MSNVGAEDELELRPWDRRITRSIGTADFGRRWAVVLGVIGIMVIAASLIGNYLLIYRGGDFEASDAAAQVKLGRYLTQGALPVAFGGILLALGFVVALSSARLDLDIVRDDEEETSDASPTEASVWAPPPTRG
jgi:hypothetical protein